MDEPYLPEADFIVMVANEDIPLTGSVMADHNLKLLIAYTRDEIVSNRDWATMVLAGHGPDTAEVLAALLSAYPSGGPRLARIADCPVSKLSDLLPWNWRAVQA